MLVGELLGEFANPSIHRQRLLQQRRHGTELLYQPGFPGLVQPAMPGQ